MTLTEKHAALARIVASIGLTNNGKLMISRIDSREDRDLVPQLIAEGFLERGSFMESGDAVLVAGTIAKYGMPISEIRPVVRCSSPPWIDGPDYEGMILARQEAEGYYD